MYEPTKTRKRVEKRHRLQRIAWLKKHTAAILGTLVLVAMTSIFTYIFWYNYIPTDVGAADGQAKIYIDYTVKSGDTLDSISNRYYKKHGYDKPCSFENEVINLNHLHGRINYLQVGQDLKLPKIVNVEIYEL